LAAQEVTCSAASSIRKLHVMNRRLSRPEWADLIGEYGSDLAKFYVLEDSGELKILSGWFDLETLTSRVGR
jgi:hypothetical protein